MGNERKEEGQKWSDKVPLQIGGLVHWCIGALVGSPKGRDEQTVVTFSGPRKPRRVRETNHRFFANPVRLESGSETVWAVQMEQDGADGAWWIPALHQREIVVWEPVL